MSFAPRMATRVYALALGAFPPGHRADYAAEMLDTFERELATRSREHGNWHALRFALAACLNVVSEGLGERRRRRRFSRTPARSHVLGALGRDLVHAVRSLAKARAFTLVCVVSLGVGMGTVMAILVVRQAVFAPPPGVKADGLVELLIMPIGPLEAQTGGRMIDTWSYPDFVDVRDAETGMAITGWTVGEGMLRMPDGGGTVRVPTMYVSANYFTTVGVGLARGPGFDAPARNASTPEPVVIVGHYLWQNRLGADPEIIGRTLALNRVEHLVVGVAPPRFQSHVSPEDGPSIDLWVPLSQHPRLLPQAADSLRVDRDADFLRVLGRLSPGTSLVHANAAVSSIVSGLAERYPTSNEFKAASVEVYSAMGARMRTDVMAAQAMMLGLSGMVLLVVCLNISGMVLVRSATRERELAVRVAIGASRGRLMQYLLSEAVVLAVLGGSLAAAVLFGGPAVLIWWFDAPLNPDVDLLRPDARMAAYCVGLCFVTSLVFGLLPAIRFSRPSLVSALKDDAGGGRRRVGRVHRLTAAFQAGLAVPFLVIGGVKLDSVRTTATADLGFEPAGLFAAPLDSAAAGYAGDRAAFFMRTARENLGRASGVVSVTLADGLPLDFRRRLIRLSRQGEPALVVRTRRGSTRTIWRRWASHFCRAAALRLTTAPAPSSWRSSPNRSPSDCFPMARCWANGSPFL